MPKHILRIATRKSPLALWQARHVGALITQHWPDWTIELLPMLTSGDKFTKDALQAIGGKGLFVKELEEALLDKRADLAVHSMKDVPALLPEGLIMQAMCKRDNPLDAFVSDGYSSLEEMLPGSVVGTTSLRRQSQLLAFRPDLTIKPLRGNIQTRLEKLARGEFDAIILAAAGLERMGLHDTIRTLLSDELILPACGQGALGLECRAGDTWLHELLQPLHDELTSACVTAERWVNARLGGNCHVPLAVFCTPKPDHHVLLRAKVLSADGQTSISAQQSGRLSDAIALADTCADALLARGADKLLYSA